MSGFIVNPFRTGAGSGGGATTTAGLVIQVAGRLMTGFSDNDPVTTWDDVSVNNNDLTQSDSTRRALYKTNVINGLPALLFDGSNDRYTIPNVLSSLTEGEIFVVLKLNADPPATFKDGLWKMDTASQSSNVPFSSDGKIYDAWGATARKSTNVNPTPSMASPCVYNVSSKASEWTCRLNGAQLFQTVTNTVGFSTTPELGRSSGGGDIFLDGYCAEMRIFDHVLSASDRDVEEADLGAIYGITMS